MSLIYSYGVRRTRFKDWRRWKATRFANGVESCAIYGETRGDAVNALAGLLHMVQQ